MLSISILIGFDTYLDGIDGSCCLKVICHIVLGIPLLVLYLTCIYILVLLESITFGHITPFRRDNNDEISFYLGSVIENRSCKYLVLIFVYIPMTLPTFAVMIICFIRFCIYRCCCYTNDYVEGERQSLYCRMVQYVCCICSQPIRECIQGINLT
jgi:hypothetical protein